MFKRQGLTVAIMKDIYLPLKVLIMVPDDQFIAFRADYCQRIFLALNSFRHQAAYYHHSPLPVVFIRCFLLLSRYLPCLQKRLLVSEKL